MGGHNKKQTPIGDRVKEITKDNWRVYLQWIANGGTRAEAAVAAKISVQTVKAYCMVEPEAMNQIRQAEREWIRRDWPIERIDEFLAWVAMGFTNKDAAKKCDFMDGELNQLMTIILGDETIRGMYDEARKLQAENWADEMVEIANQTEGDFYLDDKGQLKVAHDAVNRAKLKIGTYQWIISRLHHERFGDRMTQKHEGELTVNHADVLDNARKRKEQAQRQNESMLESALTETTAEQRVH